MYAYDCDLIFVHCGMGLKLENKTRKMMKPVEEIIRGAQSLEFKDVDLSAPNTEGDFLADFEEMSFLMTETSRQIDTMERRFIVRLDNHKIPIP
jgi:hypothetical protein